ncbi:peptidoglycan hydrolase-like protein with peptidoglycan-binding domain [Clostridium acetobutylicum]|uniref:Peptodoglycan-binding domain containing protein n=1 Tax=Clostridium acetobutylicum (strain ATCC 824 / DSM 792 / JCM 1419 / IAM 19013 / LMG 5710 / NBRC 13948 / NRRL B-527 / VKM B-1787 / 2291 / W) TaxID=272562 RepID=Q97JH0_CLOAB|nr:MULTISPECIES: peptidoglycan-binding protein [Clostridium]AAK79284.1 Peptodoglycan-binding domain containing protein [Clostridium acetobutylicum ATCC 824]ADZ20366.1 Peptodoglycan-binding domain containing protein [Clostridium acetobutylicum EA 2018]AEI31762.1 peptodoglycan-binding domain-containing protein [Clostridium acetobutylicum DSM 1731]AWV81466.1 peptidoglycan-binding protein [Clostridium acetobutylicum]MBC2393103.1 peptidoglycan-binding protein [Clostridium acetobutylicum]
MKNLKLKALSLGIVSTVLISSSAFAAIPTVIQNHPIPKVSAPVATNLNATKSKMFASTRTYGTSFGRYMTAQQVIDNGGIIQEGDTGEPVADIQRRLGIYDDGIFGSATYSAVVDFQRRIDREFHRNGYSDPLALDGIVGAQTWYYLK